MQERFQKTCGLEFSCLKTYKSVHVHRLAKISEHLLSTTPARILLVGIAGFAAEQFLIFVGHGTAADPFSSFVNMNMIEFRHGSTSPRSHHELRRLHGP
jgi:hypothetical protein